MPRDINGNTSPLPGTIVNTGDTILPSQHNPMVNDVYAMMSQSLSRDGQGGMRAPLDMSGFRILNVGPAAASTDAVSLSQFQTGTPIGTVVDFAGTSAPETWLLCFGQAVSRTTYAALFAVIGTTYGAGDGATTFNVPDCRGRVIAGKDDMGGADAGRLSTFFGSVARTIGGVMGTASHILNTGQLPPHSHGVNDPGHQHNWGNTAQGFAVAVGTAGAFGQGAVPPGALFTSSATTGITIQDSGSGQAHTNTQPTVIMNKIIKVSY